MTTASLDLAVAAARHGGAAHLAALGRSSGVAAFEALLADLSQDARHEVATEAAELDAAGVWACLIGCAGYPDRLAAVQGAPPVLFCTGPPDLLHARGVSVCGSRAASEQGVREAVACSEAAVEAGLTVVSGYARGVDTASHVAALRAGGSTVIVLPEGIRHFRIKRGDVATSWDPTRTLVVSQFPPLQSWTAGGAMARNTVIIGLGEALVVIEAGDTGGTLNAGMRALALNRPVFAVDPGESAAGTMLLTGRGALPTRSRAEFADQLAALGPHSNGNQFSMF